MFPNVKIDYVVHSGKQHGLEDHMDHLLDNEPYDLIILPDSSSNDIKYHEELSYYGTKCLILDHHIVEEKISDSAVVINNQISPDYTNKDLTGAGVVYQFCRYYDKKYGYNFADQFIDLAALGICGDMGSMLSEENQFIIRTGFKKINNYFFKQLIDKQSYSMGGLVNATTVAFYIVPLINAMIRVGSDEEKIRMFEAFINGKRKIPSKKRGANGALEENAIESVRECVNAKAKQTRIKEAAIERIEYKIHKENLLDNKILIIRLDDTDDFPAELNGLVAMGLAAKFKRPTIVARLNTDGYIRGSARGLSNCELEDLRQFFNNSGYFEYNQGHANAFGTSILNRNLFAFHQYANDTLSNCNFANDVYDVNFQRIAADEDIYDIISDIDEHREVFGTGNSEPLLYITDINLKKSDIQVIGARKDTLKFEKFGITYVKFHATNMIEELSKYNEVKIEIVGRCNMNVWMGKRTPQIFIDDYEAFDNTNGF